MEWLVMRPLSGSAAGRVVTASLFWRASKDVNGQRKRVWNCETSRGA
jgi:hypothetical protein